MARSSGTFAKGDDRAPKGAGRGGPAKGAHPHVGSAGDGWGGPAKPPRAPFEPGNQMQALGHDSYTIMLAEQRSDAIKAQLFHLGLNAERQETQVAACNSYLSKTEPPPVQRVLTAVELMGADGKQSANITVVFRSAEPTPEA